MMKGNMEWGEGGRQEEKGGDRPILSHIHTHPTCPRRVPSAVLPARSLCCAPLARLLVCPLFPPPCGVCLLPTRGSTAVLYYRTRTHVHHPHAHIQHAQNKPRVPFHRNRLHIVRLVVQLAQNSAADPVDSRRMWRDNGQYGGEIACWQGGKRVSRANAGKKKRTPGRILDCVPHLVALGAGHTHSNCLWAGRDAAGIDTAL